MLPRKIHDIDKEFIENFSKSRKEPGWMLKTRVKAWKEFINKIFPTMREEEWRYTDIKKLNINDLKSLIGKENISKDVKFLEDTEKQIDLTSGIIDACDMEMVNRNVKKEVIELGVIFNDLSEELNTASKIVKDNFMTTIKDNENKFTALHSAIWNQGIILYIPPNVHIKNPFVYNIQTNTPESAVFTHILIVMGDNSSATFLDRSTSIKQETGFHSGFTEMILGRGSHLKYSSLQEWDTNMYDISIKRIKTERDSNADIKIATLGGKMSRLEIEGFMESEGSNCNIQCIFFGDQDRHIDILTNSHHYAPHTSCDITVKGVLRDTASSIAQGMIKISKDRKQTNSKLTQNTLLLSPTAKANAKPDLEIDQNEVIAAHSATVSRVDRDQLFYLMSRGLEEKDAETLIVDGFYEGMIKQITIEEVKNRVRKVISERVARQNKIDKNM